MITPAVTGESLYNSVLDRLGEIHPLNKGLIISAPSWHALSPATQRVYDTLAGTVNTQLITAPSIPTFTTSMPATPSGGPLSPSPAPGTVIPWTVIGTPPTGPAPAPATAGVAQPTNPLLNEPRIRDLYNGGKSEDYLLRMFVNMSYEDLKRIIGKQ